MLPMAYRCSGCDEKFSFPFRDALYCLGGSPESGEIANTDLFHIPLRPAWCLDCGTLTVVEDIAPLGVFEGAYAYVRSGRHVEYPISTEDLTPEEADDEVTAFLRWRMARRHAPRALCCGGARYHFMDLAQPLIKHAGCETGYVAKGGWHLGASIPIRIGLHSRVETRTYNAEGELIGLLTWYDRDSKVWGIEPAAYPPSEPDEPDFIHGQST